jgi:hypothetical protein
MVHHRDWVCKLSQESAGCPSVAAGCDINDSNPGPDIRSTRRRPLRQSTVSSAGRLFARAPPRRHPNAAASCLLASRLICYILSAQSLGRGPSAGELFLIHALERHLEKLVPAHPFFTALFNRPKPSTV